MNEEKQSGESRIDRKTRIGRFLPDFNYTTVRHLVKIDLPAAVTVSGLLSAFVFDEIFQTSLIFLWFLLWVLSRSNVADKANLGKFIYAKYQRSYTWIPVVLTLVFFNATAHAQIDTEESTEGQWAIEENQGEPTRTTPETVETAASETTPFDRADTNRTDLTLSEFLFAIRLGPYFSFGLWTGLLGEIETAFKLHDRGYLSLITGVKGGYQIEYERGDYLFSETLGYRLYLPSSFGNAWTFFGGLSFGYFTTTQGVLERGFDWLHLGLKVKGGYYFLTNRRVSIGIDVGFSLAYQLSEFVGAADFLVAIPDLSVTLLF